MTKVLGFHSLVARYFHAQDNQQQAQRSYELMCQVDPQHPSTRVVASILNPSRLAGGCGTSCSGVDPRAGALPAGRPSAS